MSDPSWQAPQFTLRIKEMTKAHPLFDMKYNSMKQTLGERNNKSVTKGLL